jgi:hypothetical protein
VFLCEKDAIADLVYQETGKWDVPLSVLRGESSKGFMWDNARAIDAADKPTYLHFIGDHDEKGDSIIESACKRIRRYARTKHPIYWQKIAVTPEQIAEYKLPLRPSKPARDGAEIPAAYENGSVEVDALPPEILRQLINKAIVRHVDERALAIAQTAEHSERALMARITGNLPQIEAMLDSAG